MNFTSACTVFRNKSRNSVVSIKTILQAGESVVRLPADAGDFSHLRNVQTGSGSGSPSLICNGYRGSYREGKSAGVYFDHLTSILRGG